MKKRRKNTKKGLGNPALITAVASNPELAKQVPVLAKQAQDGALRAVKTIATIGGCVILGYVGYKAYKKWQDRQKTKTVAGDTKGAYLSKDEAHTLADKLFSAMDGPGTNLTKIKEVFQKVVNTADVNLIIQEFGVRKGTYSLGSGQTLPEWINDDISSASDRETYINSILRAKGITKTF